METTSTPTEREKTINTLTQHGYRVEYVCPDFTLLAKPTTGTIQLMEVSNEGSVRLCTLGDFLRSALSN